MSFTASFYFNTSEPFRLDKDLQSVALSVQNCVFKQSSSIMDPVLVLRYSDDVEAQKYFSANYVTLGTPINRSYFIEKPTVLANQLIEIQCHVDVLSTYKTQIRANKAIVQRQENRWNLYLDDGSFKVYQNPIIQTKLFPSGFNDGSNFILAIAGS